MPSTTQEIIYEAIEDYFRPRIADHYNQEVMDKLTPEDATKIVMWIETFLDAVQIDCPELEVSESWSLDREKLVQHYLDLGVRREMGELLQRIMALESMEDHIRQQDTGHLVTGLPENIAFMYEQQLRVAQNRLPERYREAVLAVCNEELGIYVCDMQLKIGAGWKDMGSGYFCAVINDAWRLTEQCEDRNEEYLESAEFQESGEALTRDLSELSLHATKYLCQRILLHLQEPEAILTSVGDAVWEDDKGPSAVERAVATFKDYFQDLEHWLISDYYFPKVLKNCFDLSLQTYLESFYANTISRGVKDPAMVAEELRNDYLRWVIFFNGSSCEKYHGVGGFYTQLVINERLRILQNMAALVDPSVKPEDAKDDVKAVRLYFNAGEDASAVVLHLAGLRKRHRHQESIMWLKTIATAKKEIEEDDETSEDSQITVSSYKVPDLRNSRYVGNIRPAKRDIHRQLSGPSLERNESTFRLLHHQQKAGFHPSRLLVRMGRGNRNQGDVTN